MIYSGNTQVNIRRLFGGPKLMFYILEVYLKSVNPRLRIFFSSDLHICCLCMFVSKVSYSNFINRTKRIRSYLFGNIPFDAVHLNTTVQLTLQLLLKQYNYRIKLNSNNTFNQHNWICCFCIFINIVLRCNTVTLNPEMISSTRKQAL